MKSPNLEVVDREENGIEIKHWDCVDCPPSAAVPWVTYVQAKISALSVKELSLCGVGKHAVGSSDFQVPAGLYRSLGHRNAQSQEDCREGRSVHQPWWRCLCLRYKAKRAIQIFFSWPIDGALQLVFCLEWEFSNSLKHAVLWC